MRLKINISNKLVGHWQRVGARGANTTSKDARINCIRCLETAVAATWLAVGADRYEESYNSHGVRV